MTRYADQLRRLEEVLAQRDYTSLYACSSGRQNVDITRNSGRIGMSSPPTCDGG
jgi:hypothetical protein